MPLHSDKKTMKSRSIARGFSRSLRLPMPTRSVGMIYRLLLVLIFFAFLVGGIRFFRDWDATVGSQDIGRSETPGELSYNKMQAAVVWGLAMKLLLWMAFAFDFS